jgi:hypothetical protein
MGAAQAAAVGPLRLPGADALDEHRLLGPGDLGRLLSAMSLSISKSVKHIIALAVEVFLRLVGLAAGGHDGDPMVHQALALGGLIMVLKLPRNRWCQP